MAKISDIILLQQPETYALAIEVHTDMSGMAMAIGKNFMEIDALFKEQGMVTTDIPFVEYPHFDAMTERNIRMTIGFKSAKPLCGKGDIKSIVIPERKIVSCLHWGNYTELASLYREMQEWITANGYKASGTSVEYYYSKPGTSEEEMVTRIEMPVISGSPVHI